MKKIMIFLVNIYQKTLSWILVPFFGNGCRFFPTCSQYAKEAWEQQGFMKGSFLSFKRLMKCHPYV